MPTINVDLHVDDHNAISLVEEPGHDQMNGRVSLFKRSFRARSLIVVKVTLSPCDFRSATSPTSPHLHPRTPSLPATPDGQICPTIRSQHSRTRSDVWETVTALEHPAQSSKQRCSGQSCDSRRTTGVFTCLLTHSSRPSKTSKHR